MDYAGVYYMLDYRQFYKYLSMKGLMDNTQTKPSQNYEISSHYLMFEIKSHILFW